MKKLIIIITLLITISTSAQSIKSIDVKENGSTSISTEEFVVGHVTDRISTLFSTNIQIDKVSPDTTLFGFIISVRFLCGSADFEIDRKGRMLIKTMEDEIIELQCISVTDIPTGYSAANRNRFFLAGGHNTYYLNEHMIQAHYLINYTDIQKLEAGVKKIRFQTTRTSFGPDNYLEKKFMRDQCGTMLYESFVMMLDRIANISEEPAGEPMDISENF